MYQKGPPRVQAHVPAAIPFELTVQAYERLGLTSRLFVIGDGEEALDVIIAGGK